VKLAKKTIKGLHLQKQQQYTRVLQTNPKSISFNYVLTIINCFVWFPMINFYRLYKRLPVSFLIDRKTNDASGSWNGAFHAKHRYSISSSKDTSLITKNPLQSMSYFVGLSMWTWCMWTCRVLFMPPMKFHFSVELCLESQPKRSKSSLKCSALLINAAHGVMTVLPTLAGQNCGGFFAAPLIANPRRRLLAIVSLNVPLSIGIDRK